MEIPIFGTQFTNSPSGSLSLLYSMVSVRVCGKIGVKIWGKIGDSGCKCDCYREKRGATDLRGMRIGAHVDHERAMRKKGNNDYANREDLRFYVGRRRRST